MEFSSVFFRHNPIFVYAWEMIFYTVSARPILPIRQIKNRAVCVSYIIYYIYGKKKKSIIIIIYNIMLNVQSATILSSAAYCGVHVLPVNTDNAIFVLEFGT